MYVTLRKKKRKEERKNSRHKMAAFAVLVEMTEVCTSRFVEQMVNVRSCGLELTESNNVRCRRYY